MTDELYTASNGTRWYVECIEPPVPTREFDWSAYSENGDGGSGVFGATRAAAIAAVEELIAECAP